MSSMYRSVPDSKRRRGTLHYQRRCRDCPIRYDRTICGPVLSCVVYGSACCCCHHAPCQHLGMCAVVHLLIGQVRLLGRFYHVSLERCIHQHEPAYILGTVIRHVFIERLNLCDQGNAGPRRAHIPVFVQMSVTQP